MSMGASAWTARLFAAAASRRRAPAAVPALPPLRHRRLSTRRATASASAASASRGVPASARSAGKPRTG